MSRVLFRLLPLLVLSAAVPACGGRTGGFQAGTVISPEDYEITGFACTSRIAKARVDGELVDQEQWLGSGTITNKLQETSPNYQMRFTAMFEDGTSTVDGTATLVFPLEPGESTEFSFLVKPFGKVPVDCSVVLWDSVLNW